jgi:hypothetical protein
LLHDYAETLRWAGETCLLGQTPKSISEARQFLQKSFGIWTLMRDRGTLSKADAHHPEELSTEVAQCDAAIKWRLLLRQLEIRVLDDPKNVAERIEDSNSATESPFSSL